MNYLLLAALDTASTDTTQGAEMGSMIGTVGMLLIFFVVFYFFLIRPQRKQEKETRRQISEMMVGDRVQTIGGLVGVVANFTDTEVTIYTSMANTPVTFLKSAIQTVTPRNAKATAKNEEKKAAKKAKEVEKADKAAKKEEKEDKL
ncbi:MAG: preprotein translocase subunit YajC [Saccharofermentans sp.]|nr:preprotein translocase subunit YajC [Saccharofermentans sp.]